MELTFEQGPIRPPSEAESLLIRATRNCPWNKCTFCHSYRNSKFSLRSVEEIKKEIDAVHDTAQRIRELSWKQGQGGKISDTVIHMIFNDYGYSDAYRSVAAWLYFGGRSVFLQDANSIIMKTDDLVEVLQYIKEKFPFVNRITSYGRSKTAAKKEIKDFVRLRTAGLSRIHVGMESGYDPVLEFIKKGETAADHVEGGKRIMAGGISLCEYIMPGLGGDRWSTEHAMHTAEVLNTINPDFIRIRSLQVREGTALFDTMRNNLFRPLGDEDVLNEIRQIIENLHCQNTYIVSDHILNLLQEIEGMLPDDKRKMLDIIDRYFGMSEKDRMIYRLGRRRGLFNSLDDLSNTRLYERLKMIVEEYEKNDPTQLDRDLYKSMHGFI
ncbi:MAG: radical SAM protein [Deltaproteobacteria bacterium]|jgi:histone acetyltransferase (RNA polymerase elongator complex component)|nr:radical SAM protein [Deltaproteobacteria bacterium]